MKMHVCRRICSVDARQSHELGKTRFYVAYDFRYVVFVGNSVGSNTETFDIQVLLVVRWK